MIDRLFFAALTFCLLIGGTLAIGSTLFDVDLRSAATRATLAPAKVIELERVVIIGKRLAPPTEIAHARPAQGTSRRVE